MAKRPVIDRLDAVSEPSRGRQGRRHAGAARDVAKAARASATATAAAARALERELEPPPAETLVDPYTPDWSRLDELELQDIEDWSDALGEYDQGSGVRISVWRHGQGRTARTWLGWLEDPHDPDLLARIRDMAQTAGLSGEQAFHLQPVSRRTHRFVPELGARQVTILVPAAPLTPVTPAAVDPVAGAKAIVETAQALNPRGATADPLDVVTKTLTMMDKMRPGESVSDKLLALLPTVLPALKDLFAPKPSAMDQAVAELIRQRLVRELGPGEGGGALVDQVEQIRTVVEVLKPLVGGGEGEPRTAGVALIDTLPEVVKHLAAPIDKLADAYRWRMRAAAAPAAPPPGPAALPPHVQALWRDVAAAAARVDDGFFPVLMTRLRETFEGADAFLGAVRAGQVADEQGLATFESLGGTLTPPTRAYVVRFFNWLRWTGASTRPAAPPGPGPTITTAAPTGNGAPAGSAVVGRCEREGCGVEYIFDSEADWTVEQADPCERCGGRILRVEAT